jgi:hypothetical protein
VIAEVDRLAIFVDRGVDMAEAEFCAAGWTRKMPMRGSRGLSRIAHSASAFALSKRPRESSAAMRGT